MSTEGTPARRWPSRRAADVPRSPEIDALLRDVDSLRLSLETDLTLAASAVEAGEPGLAADIVGAEREVLADFEARSLGRLETLSASELESASRRRHLWGPAQAASMVAAAALVGLLAGVVPQVISNQPRDTSPVAASESLERLQELATGGDEDEIRAVSAQLHQELAGVLAVAGEDPVAAQNALLLLSYEQAVIARSADRGALADVLRQSQALARAIRAALPASVRKSVPVAPIVVAPPQESAKPKASTASSPKPAPKPSATASPTAKPSSSASPSSDPYKLPNPPIAP